MDLYTTERWILERHQETVAAVERRVRLHGPRRVPAPVRLWAAYRLRSLADRLDDRALSASEA